jgi:hypothetical protein
MTDQRRPSPPVPRASLVPRKLTAPCMPPPPAAYPDEEEPTRPGLPPGLDARALLDRLAVNLTPAERRELVLLCDAWFRCNANGRALLGGLANELALPL